MSRHLGTLVAFARTQWNQMEGRNSEWWKSYYNEKEKQELFLFHQFLSPRYKLQMHWSFVLFDSSLSVCMSLYTRLRIQNLNNFNQICMLLLVMDRGIFGGIVGVSLIFSVIGLVLVPLAQLSLGYCWRHGVTSIFSLIGLACSSFSTTYVWFLVFLLLLSCLPTLCSHKSQSRHSQ